MKIFHNQIIPDFKTNRFNLFPAISQCSQFANPQFGSVRVGQDQAGRTVATFQCNINYQLSGPAMLTCVNGIWNGPAPTCVPRGRLQTLSLHLAQGINGLVVKHRDLW